MTDAPLFTAVDHVGIAVEDLEIAVAFYEKTFGMTCYHVEENAEQGVREAMLRPADSSQTSIQLLAPLSSTSTIATFLAKRGPGVQQLAYRVTDLDAACASLRADGMRLLYDEPRLGTAGSRVNFVHPASTGGVLVELVESAQADDGTKDPCG